VVIVVVASCAFASAAERTPATAAFSEPNRPQFHYTPARNWLNDPNGLVFVDGEWHLFHQYNPEGIESANKSWAHAVSRDLVHWEHLPLAIRYGDGIEIWSGSAVVDSKNTSGFGTKESPPLAALYTAAGHGKQAQHLTYSTDRGRTWAKYAGNPVLDENLKEFRDPKVCWHEPTQRWVMVVALSDRRRVRFYASADLKKWTQLSEFGGQGSTEGVWECPDLFPLTLGGQTVWLLVANVSSGGPAAGGSATQYFVGDFDGATFRNANAKDVKLWTDYGPDTYAAQTWSDVANSDGRRISIGWMTSLHYCTLEPTFPWRGAMTLPRELSLVETKNGPRLAQSPVRELSAIRGEELSQKQFATAGQTLEIEATIERAASMSFAVCADEKSQTMIGYDAARQEIYVDRTNSRAGAPFHKDFPGRYAAPVVSRAGEEIPLRVFVDRTSVEVFADNGLSVLTVNTFPDPAAVGLTPPADWVRSFKVRRLKSIWDSPAREPLP
jgi:fructan beta-fructosidase